MGYPGTVDSYEIRSPDHDTQSAVGAMSLAQEGLPPRRCAVHTMGIVTDGTFDLAR